ncbi:MAG: SRPBCC family protein [Anaerolineae bacterium]
MPKFDYEEEISASWETVWGIVSDPNAWPQWFPEIESMSNFTGLAEGGTFNYQYQGMEGDAKITALRTDRETKEIEINTDIRNNRAWHWFRVGPKKGFGASDGVSWLNYHMEYSAAIPILGEIVEHGNDADEKVVRDTVYKVKFIAEGAGKGSPSV